MTRLHSESLIHIPIEFIKLFPRLIRIEGQIVVDIRPEEIIPLPSLLEGSFYIIEALTETYLYRSDKEKVRFRSYVPELLSALQVGKKISRASFKIGQRYEPETNIHDIRIIQGYRY